MFKTTQLGHLLDGSEKRDAIHIAVAPVVACERLRPGEHIGLAKADSDTDVTKSAKRLIGIVDPFLSIPIECGQRFYMFLYPNTITSLNHLWTHPAFGSDIDKAKSEIALMAASAGFSYDFLMSCADDWADGGDYEHRGDDESYNRIDFELFWKYYEIVTGKKVNADKKYCFFSCAC